MSIENRIREERTSSRLTVRGRFVVGVVPEMGSVICDRGIRRKFLSGEGAPAGGISSGTHSSGGEPSGGGEAARNNVERERRVRTGDGWGACGSEDEKRAAPRRRRRGAAQRKEEDTVFCKEEDDHCL